MELLCLDWINSRADTAAAPARDKLADPAWFQGFLARWSLPAFTPTGRELAALAAERDTLRDMALRFSNGQALTGEDIGWLNAQLSRGNSRRQLEREGGALRLTETPSAGAAVWLAYCAALSFAELAAQSMPERLKQCANPTCGWLFYDDSKSRARKWCDGRCANRMKVRRYRARRATDGGGAPNDA